MLDQYRHGESGRNNLHSNTVAKSEKLHRSYYSQVRGRPVRLWVATLAVLIEGSPE